MVQYRYIVFTIKNYIIFNNNLDLINLIDTQIINKKEKIYGTDINVLWYNSKQPTYDYICEIDIFPHIYINEFESYVKEKIVQIQNYIKFNFEYFGLDWYIDYKIMSK